MKVFIMRTVRVQSHIYCLSVKFDFFKSVSAALHKTSSPFSADAELKKKFMHYFAFSHPSRSLVVFWGGGGEGRGANTMDTGENLNSSVTTLKLFEEEEI